MGRDDFKYYEMSNGGKGRLIEVLRGELEARDIIIFAYIHGGFLERRVFRDIDVVDLPATLEVKLGVPVDIHVINGAPLAFKYHVFMKGKLLFSRNNAMRAEVIDEAVRGCMDAHLLYGALGGSA